MTENTKNNSRRIKLRCLQLVEDKHKKDFDDGVIGCRKLQKDFFVLFFILQFDRDSVVIFISFCKVY